LKFELEKDKKILIVEDDPEIRINLVNFLDLTGFTTIEAHNGFTGIKLARETHPDLIISDIMMPGMDGFQLLEELQKDESTDSIPFLFLSAKADKIFIREGMNLGADDFITKPFDFDELLIAVNTRINKKHKREKHLNKKIEDLQTNLKRTMPHEVRTPLNIILGLSEYLIKNLNRSNHGEITEMLHNIHDSGKRLLRMFENYLYYANLEVIAGNPSEIAELLGFKTSLTEPIIRDIISSLDRNGERTSDIELILDDAEIRISEHHFAKIVEEVFDNCLKFSEKGDKILVKTKKAKDYFVLIFKDFGRGMTEEQIKNIDAYVQFERKIYEQQGTGLGLSIVKRLADLHKGSIDINSSPNNFTELTIRIPLIS
jgi:two-component system sensor histidine kinase/response regulator